MFDERDRYASSKCQGDLLSVELRAPDIALYATMYYVTYMYAKFAPTGIAYLGQPPPAPWRTVSLLLLLLVLAAHSVLQTRSR